MFSLFTYGGLLFIFRWLHFLGGITWIGMLYYINFVHGGFMAQADAATKTQILTKQYGNVLWWFRWGAMLTIISGWSYLGMNHVNFHSSYGVTILSGATLGTIMWANVWFVIWPANKINIEVAAGKIQAPPTLPAQLARSGVCSRTNVLFSIPLLFFMGAASHLGIQVSETANLGILAAAIGIIIAALEFNALKGKNGPMTTVKGVIHCGIGLTIVLYVLVELLTH